MHPQLATPVRVLQIALGLTATLAGLDKFFDILADWGAYVSPFAASVLPFSVGTFMAIVGGIEVTVGITILALAPRLGAYVASAWLLLVAVNLAIGGHFDVAVRDVVMSIAAFAVARAVEVERSARERSHGVTRHAYARGVDPTWLQLCGPQSSNRGRTSARTG